MTTRYTNWSYILNINFNKNEIMCVRKIYFPPRERFIGIWVIFYTMIVFLSDFLVGGRRAGHHRSRVWVVVRFFQCVGDFVCDSYFYFFCRSRYSNKWFNFYWSLYSIYSMTNWYIEWSFILNINFNNYSSNSNSSSTSIIDHIVNKKKLIVVIVIVIVVFA